MVKQLKKSNIKKSLKSQYIVKKRNHKKLLRRKNKIILKIKKLSKKTRCVFNKKYQYLTNIHLLEKFFYQLTIKITSNNVFCTFSDLKEKKTIAVGSAGKYNIKTSKKKLRFSTKTVLQSFLKSLKKKIKIKQLLLKITGPIRIRKKLLKDLGIHLKNVNLIIETNNLRCFNGCRAPKKKRKKGSKKWRILK